MSSHDRWEFKSQANFNVMIFEMLQSIIRRLDDMAIDLTHLTAEVADVATVEASAVVLIQGIAQKIADAVASAGVDPAAQATVDGLVAQLKGSSDALAAAITANTPAAPAPVADPAPAPAPVVDPAPVAADPAPAPAADVPPADAAPTA
jgi:hypothetical protein